MTADTTFNLQWEDILEAVSGVSEKRGVATTAIDGNHVRYTWPDGTWMAFERSPWWVQLESCPVLPGDMPQRKSYIPGEEAAMQTLREADEALAKVELGHIAERVQLTCKNCGSNRFVPKQDAKEWCLDCDAAYEPKGYRKTFEGSTERGFAKQRYFCCLCAKDVMEGHHYVVNETGHVAHEGCADGTVDHSRDPRLNPEKGDVLHKKRCQSREVVWATDKSVSFKTERGGQKAESLRRWRKWCVGATYGNGGVL